MGKQKRPQKKRPSQTVKFNSTTNDIKGRAPEFQKVSLLKEMKDQDQRKGCSLPRHAWLQSMKKDDMNYPHPDLFIPGEMKFRNAFGRHNPIKKRLPPLSQLIKRDLSNMVAGDLWADEELSLKLTRRLTSAELRFLNYVEELDTEVVMFDSEMLKSMESLVDFGDESLDVVTDTIPLPFHRRIIQTGAVRNRRDAQSTRRSSLGSALARQSSQRSLESRASIGSAASYNTHDPIQMYQNPINFLLSRRESTGSQASYSSAVDSPSVARSVVSLRAEGPSIRDLYGEHGDDSRGRRWRHRFDLDDSTQRELMDLELDAIERRIGRYDYRHHISEEEIDEYNSEDDDGTASHSISASISNSTSTSSYVMSIRSISPLRGTEAADTLICRSIIKVLEHSEELDYNDEVGDSESSASASQVSASESVSASASASYSNSSSNVSAGLDGEKAYPRSYLKASLASNAPHSSRSSSDASLCADSSSSLSSLINSDGKGSRQSLYASPVAKDKRQSSKSGSISPITTDRQEHHNLKSETVRAFGANPIQDAKMSCEMEGPLPSSESHCSPKQYGGFLKENDDQSESQRVSVGPLKASDAVFRQGLESSADNMLSRPDCGEKMGNEMADMYPDQAWKGGKSILESNLSAVPQDEVAGKALGRESFTNHLKVVAQEKCDPGCNTHDIAPRSVRFSPATEFKEKARLPRGVVQLPSWWLKSAYSSVEREEAPKGIISRDDAVNTTNMLEGVNVTLTEDERNTLPLLVEEGRDALRVDSKVDATIGVAGSESLSIAGGESSERNPVSGLKGRMQSDQDIGASHPARPTRPISLKSLIDAKKKSRSSRGIAQLPSWWVESVPHVQTEFAANEGKPEACSIMPKETNIDEPVSLVKLGSVHEETEQFAAVEMCVSPSEDTGKGSRPRVTNDVLGVKTPTDAPLVEHWSFTGVQRQSFQGAEQGPPRSQLVEEARLSGSTSPDLTPTVSSIAEEVHIVSDLVTDIGSIALPVVALSPGGANEHGISILQNCTDVSKETLLKENLAKDLFLKAMKSEFHDEQTHEADSSFKEAIIVTNATALLHTAATLTYEFCPDDVVGECLKEHDKIYPVATITRYSEGLDLRGLLDQGVLDPDNVSNGVDSHWNMNSEVQDVDEVATTRKGKRRTFNRAGWKAMPKMRSHKGDSKSRLRVISGLMMKLKRHLQGRA